MFDILDFRHLTNHKDVRCFAESQETGRLYIGTRSNELIAINRFSLEELFSVDLHEPISFISISENSTKIMVGTLRGSLLTLDSSGHVVQNIKNHSANVCSIFQINMNEDHYIITSSWDSSAILYKNGSKKCIVQGHSKTVWSSLYFPMNEIIITASADHSIKIWKNDKIQQTLKEHTDSVRCLEMIDQNTFLSTSNDSYIIKWDIWGKLLVKIKAHSHFTYCVKYDSGNVISCGEDGMIKIFDCHDLKLKQSIPIHHQTCWQVILTDYSSTIYALTEDSYVLMFSNLEEKKNSSKLKEYNQLLSTSEKMTDSMTISEKNLKTLPDISVLEKPGNHDGEHILVKDNNGVIKVFTWSSVNNEWIDSGKLKVPDSLDSIPQLGKDKMFKGQEYDYVFDVDLEGKAHLKLPYNNGQNPYDAAQNFIDENNLSQNYLEQIVEFIQSNSNYKNINKVSKYFPCEIFVYYKENNLDKISKKISEFHIESCHDIDFLNKNVSDEKIMRILSMIDACEDDKKFPFLDWIRYNIFSCHINNPDFIEILCELCQEFFFNNITTSNIHNINLSLILKSMTNLIANRPTHINCSLLLEVFIKTINMQWLNNRCMLALSACMQNFIVYITKYKQSYLDDLKENIAIFLLSITEFALKTKSFDENVYVRIILSYGSYAYHSNYTDINQINTKILCMFQNFISESNRNDIVRLKDIVDDFKTTI